MKTLLFLSILTSLLMSQEYQKGKIDMHGGKYDKYNSIGGYKDGGFRTQTLDMSRYLDKNSSKKQVGKNQTQK